MTDLPVVQPRKTVVEKDLHDALIGIEPGWYTSSDLLPRYLAWAGQNGKPEVSAKTLGEAIRRAFDPKRRRVVGNVALWYLDDRVLTHRDWYV